MTEMAYGIAVPDTVEGLIGIWTQAEEQRPGVVQMLQATKSGLIVVAQVPVIAKWPSRDGDVLVHIATFRIAKDCRDDIYKAIGPDKRRKPTYFEPDSGPSNFKRGDICDLTMTLEWG